MDVCLVQGGAHEDYNMGLRVCVVVMRIYVRGLDSKWCVY